MLQKRNAYYHSNAAGPQQKCKDKNKEALYNFYENTPLSSLCKKLIDLVPKKETVEQIESKLKTLIGLIDERKLDDVGDQTAPLQKLESAVIKLVEMRAQFAKENGEKLAEVEKKLDAERKKSLQEAKMAQNQEDRAEKAKLLEEKQRRKKALIDLEPARRDMGISQKEKVKKVEEKKEVYNEDEKDVIRFLGPKFLAVIPKHQDASPAEGSSHD